MQIRSENSDQAVLAELGARIARTRLERNKNQAGLAFEAGVSKATVERLERGQSVKLTSFIRVLRALDLLDGVDHLVPEPLPSPLERLKTSGRRRQRASGRRGGARSPEGAPSGGWRWGGPGEIG